MLLFTLPFYSGMHVEGCGILSHSKTVIINQSILPKAMQIFGAFVFSLPKTLRFTFTYTEKIIMTKLYWLGGLLVALLLGTSVYAGDIQIDGAWTRATAPGRDSANVYLFITSKQAATLVGASSTASKMADLRTMTHKNGMMKTIDVKSIDLPANSRIDMSSEHGYHVTLVGLKAPLKAGETVPLTLSIEMADKKNVRADVQVEIKPQKNAAQK